MPTPTATISTRASAWRANYATPVSLRCPPQIFPGSPARTSPASTCRKNSRSSCPARLAHRPEKRWPEQNFAELAQALPIPSVIIGGAGEAPNIPGLNLTGQTSLAELAAVIARASVAIGNDTGPMHLAAALNIPSVVLFSAASDPALTAPRYPDGSWPITLSAPALSDLAVAQVLAALP